MHTGYRYACGFIALLVLGTSFFFAQAQETLPAPTGMPTITAYMFGGRECPHCADEREFFESYAATHKNVSFVEFEVWHDSENQKKMEKIADYFDIPVAGVPLTVIGSYYYVGFDAPETTGKLLDAKIREFLGNGTYEDVVQKVLFEKETTYKPSDTSLESVDLPFLGKISTNDASLPLLSVLLGFLDGFNPCAMWSLILLLGVLVSMQNRKRLIWLGGLFLLMEGMIYFAFLAAWINVLEFLQYVYFLRVAIAASAILMGIYALYKYITKPKNVCDISETRKYRLIFNRVKDLIQKKSIFFSILGVLLMAFMVNIVELMCSIGFPVVYTQILALRHVPFVQYYLYLLLYVFFYMIDDMVVYGIAIATSRISLLQGKWGSLVSLAGSILMVLLGVFLLLGVL